MKKITLTIVLTAILATLAFTGCSSNEVTQTENETTTKVENTTTVETTKTTTEAITTEASTEMTTEMITDSTTKAIVTTTAKPIKSTVTTTTTVATTTKPVETTTVTEATWKETNKSTTMYVTTDCYSRVKAIIGSASVKYYSKGTAVKVTASTNTDYYKLDTGAFIHKDYLSSSKPVVQTTTAKKEQTPTVTTTKKETTTPVDDTQAEWYMTEDDCKWILEELEKYAKENGYKYRKLEDAFFVEPGQGAWRDWMSWSNIVYNNGPDYFGDITTKYDVLKYLKGYVKEKTTGDDSLFTVDSPIFDYCSMADYIKGCHEENWDCRSQEIDNYPGVYVFVYGYC